MGLIPYFCPGLKLIRRYLMKNMIIKLIYDLKGLRDKEIINKA